jgi:hypothetical protein
VLSNVGNFKESFTKKFAGSALHRNRQKNSSGAPRSTSDRKPFCKLYKLNKIVDIDV